MPGKITILSAVLLMSALFTSAQKLKEMNITGKPRKVTETLYNIKNNGQQIDSRNTLFFSADGLLERTENDLYKADTISLTLVTFYNKKEKVTETQAHRSSGIEKTLTQYDDLDNIIKSESVTPGKTIIVSYKNKYDKKGQLIEKAVYGKLGVFKNTTMSYDKAGNKITEHVYNEATALEYADTFVYDRNHNRVKNIHHVSNDKKSSSVNITRYDSLNREVEVTIYKPGGDMNWKHLYEYNQWGDIVKNRFFYSSGSYEDTFYLYTDRDRFNNWLKKTVTEYGEPSRVVQRVIEYY